MHTLYPGEWYLRFTCTKCSSKQVLFPDLSKGEAPIRADYIVTCSECGHKDHYGADTIERYHHPADSTPVLANGV